MAKQDARKRAAIAVLALAMLGVSGCKFGTGNDDTAKIESQFRAEVGKYPNITIRSLTCVNGSGMCLYTVKVNSDANEYGRTQSTVNGQCTLTKEDALDCTNDSWLKYAEKNSTGDNPNGKVETTTPISTPSGTGDLSTNCPNLGTCTPTDPSRR